MPGRKRKDEPAPPRTLLASAARLNESKIARPRQVNSPWAQEAWSHYDLCGELRFAVNWKAGAASRARLIAGKIDRADPKAKAKPVEPLEDGTAHPAQDLMDAFGGGEDGQKQILARLMLHLEVPGDSYLVGEDELDLDGDPTGNQVWQVFSTEEVKQRGTQWAVAIGDGTDRQLPAEALVIRVWRPHPRKQWEADSPVRAVLPVLRELEGYGAHLAATVDSRLAGAGLLLLASEMGLPAAAEGGQDADGAADGFQGNLTEAMVAPMKDRGVASAVVPLVAFVPGEFVDKANHITFGTDFDERIHELREDAIRRLALGLDVPPEQLLGMGDSNHWSAWQIDEAGLKVHVVPPLQLVAQAVTQEYLRIMLREMGVEDWADYIVLVDVTELQNRPDKVAETVQAFDRFAIGMAGLRDGLGLDEGFAPDDSELQKLILLRMAMTGALTPQAAAQLGLPAGIIAAEPGAIALPGPSGAGGGPPNAGQKALPARPTATPGLAQQWTPEQALLAAATLAQALEAHGTDMSTVLLPGADDGPDPGLLNACEVLVLRALERAGNKLRGRRHGSPREGMGVDVPEHEVHTVMAISGGPERLDQLLSGAWSLAPHIAGLNSVEPAALVLALDTCARGLLATSAPYERAVLASCLTDICPRCGDSW